MTAETLADLVAAQISRIDYYDGGQLEHAERHIEILQNAVGVLCQLLVKHTSIKVQDLQDKLPNYAGSTLVKDLAHLKGIAPPPPRRCTPR